MRGTESLKITRQETWLPIHPKKNGEAYGLAADMSNLEQVD